MANRLVVVDANVIVALVSERDALHAQAVLLLKALDAANAELIYFDCVVTETASVIARRLEERHLQNEFPAALEKLLRITPADKIVPVMSQTNKYFDPAMNLMRQSLGRLNFNDALIALFCKDIGVGYIASFDTDFDHFGGLQRIVTPEQVADWAQEPS